MFRRVLVANRGEIARRIFRTCRKMGIATVAVYSDADRDALHVREADDAVHIGAAAPSASYLNTEAIVEAARRTGAEAIHPGYGFLSESPALAEACAAAGIAFIGPPPEAMRLMGDKPAARRMAAAHDVPVLPGIDETEGDGPTPERIEALGFPVMIKAAAGGGGRGMRLVESPADLLDALEGARREAAAAFGDGRLLVERAVTGGRHVEIQVLADAHGHAIHLGERDCSIQRRFQKVIEESPSPAVGEALRTQLGEAALRIVRVAGYVNAGTVEFLLDQDGGFSFLEMNTRLQVEHGVTELVTGLDLVALQFRIAAGEPLALAQDDVTMEGHAIECRIYAEDPLRGYVPSPGRVAQFVPPSGAGIRLDAGVEAGSAVPREYDPLLAKLMAQGGTRAEAIERCRAALDAFAIEGVRTNLGLLDAVLREPAFVAGDADLRTLASMPPEAFAPRLPSEVLAAAALDRLLPLPAADPWTALGAWRIDGRADLAFRFHGHSFPVRAQRRAGQADHWHLEVAGGDALEVHARRAGDGALQLEEGGSRRRWQVLPDGAVLRVRASDGREHVLTEPPVEARGERARPAAAGSSELRAPMAGAVVAVHAQPGDGVRGGQPLVVLEAMKMEHSIEAPRDGVIAEVRCEPGLHVAEGQVLVTLVIGAAAGTEEGDGAS